VSILDVAAGKRYTVEAKVLVTAVGVLNVPKEEPALEGFRCEVFHTSQWRDVDFKDKNVMVLGNGCSANQVIPWILNEAGAKSLVHIFRSARGLRRRGMLRMEKGLNGGYTRRRSTYAANVAGSSGIFLLQTRRIDCGRRYSCIEESLHSAQTLWGITFVALSHPP
jgi:cation diffusion facilitator CzcD-associated flavoprotein CzcO